MAMRTLTEASSRCNINWITVGQMWVKTEVRHRKAWYRILSTETGLPFWVLLSWPRECDMARLIPGLIIMPWVNVHISESMYLSETLQKEKTCRLLSSNCTLRKVHQESTNTQELNPSVFTLSISCPYHWRKPQDRSEWLWKPFYRQGKLGTSLPSHGSHPDSSVHSHLTN